MASRACQGLQSCLEPRIVEQRVLRLKLLPPASSFSQSFGLSHGPGSPNSHSRGAQEKSHAEENNTHITTTADDKNNKGKNNDKVIDDCSIQSQQKGELGGWSFIQALSNTSHSFKEVLENDKVYVHPLVKRSSSMLSAKSLEMCTESLGSESGSGISQSSHEASSKFAGRELSEVNKTSMKNKMTRSKSFPPPLTSISSRGSGGLQVRPHREDGRLVIEAVTIPASHSYFHADRSDGRLRLRLSKACPQNHDNEEESDKVEDSEFEAEEEAVEGGDYNEEKEEGDEADAVNGYSGKVVEEEGTEASNGNIAGEIELGKLPRPSRCMEGGGHTSNSLMNWESLWVATS